MIDLSIEDKEKQEQYMEYLRKVRSLHTELLECLNYDEMRSLDSDDEAKREFLEKEIKKLLKKTKTPDVSPDDAELVQAIIDEMLGFGPLEILLRDAGVTDIFVNAPDRIFVESKGRVRRTWVRFVDNEHIYRLVQRVASQSGRHLDLGTPYLDSSLADGSRLHAIIPPLAADGIKVSVRKFLFKKLSIDSIVEGGSLTEGMAKLLKIAVKSRFNIVICGGTGSGKTTLLNSLLDSIRDGERVITIEDTPELEPTHGHIVRLITRAPNPEGKGGVGQDTLMINALRMRPDRVVLGELRGAEAFNLLHAMNTGQDGSMVTLHASGTEEVLARLLNMILMAKYSLSVESVRQQIAGALDLVIHVARLVDGSRRVMSIAQISRDKNDEMKVDMLFRFNVEKISEKEMKGHFKQYQPTVSSRMRDKLVNAGLYEEYLDIFPDKEKVRYPEEL
jgi:pilus assembly protein CpaF